MSDDISSPKDDYWDQLILRCLDDEASDEERDELYRACQDDPAVDRALREALDTHYLLDQSGREDDGFTAGVLAAQDASPTFSHVVAERHQGRLRVHRRWWWGAALAALILAVLGGAIWLRDPAAVPLQLERVSGTVFLERDGVLEASAAQAQLLVGDRLIVGGDGDAILAHSDGSAITLHAETRLVVRSADGRHLHLEEGLVRADIRKQQPGDQVRIITPMGEVQVIGTAFDVRVHDGHADLQVHEGEVSVQPLRGERRSVRAHQRLRWTPEEVDQHVELKSGSRIFVHDWHHGPPVPQYRGMYDHVSESTLPEYSKTNDQGHRLMAISARGQWSKGLGTIDPLDQIRIRARFENAHYVVVLMLVRRKDGSITNLIHTLSGSAIDPEREIQELTVPIASMRPVDGEPVEDGHYMGYVLHPLERSNMELLEVTVERRYLQPVVSEEE